MKPIFIAALIAIVGVFYTATIREGHDWGDDFSMYIQHAKNIAEGAAYDRTSYIPNPYFTLYSPIAYPPVFPILLLPAYFSYGMSLKAMKVGVILTFLIFLLMFYLIFRDDLPFPYLAAVIAIIGFNPYLWDFKDQILSDLPFLCFLYPGLFFINRAYESTHLKTRLWSYTLTIGLLTYLAYATRAVGLVLIPCLLIYGWLKEKKISRFTVFAAVCPLLFILLQGLIIPGGQGYFSLLASNRPVISENLSVYVNSFYLIWRGDYSNTSNRVFFFALCVLAVLGYWTRIREKITSFEIFVPLYAAAILLQPFHQGRRYLIPIIPLFVLYVFVAVRKCSLFLQGRITQWATAAVPILLISIIYAGQYAKANFGPIQEGIGRKATIELFSFIVSHTDNNDVFIFRKPRALALFTGRRASLYDDGQPQQKLWDFFQTINAKYFIVSSNDYGGFLEFIERYRDSLELVYRNSDFSMYRLKLK